MASSFTFKFTESFHYILLSDENKIKSKLYLSRVAFKY